MQVEIEGELVDCFNVAFQTADINSLAAISASEEVKFVLNEKLNDLIKPHEIYKVSIIISKLEHKNAIG